MSRPTRLLLTTDAVGGVWAYTLDLAAALAARGTAVELAVLGPAATPAQAEAATAAGASLHATGLPLDWTVETPAALEQSAVALAALARGLGADLVQLHTPALVGDAAWPAPVLAVAHSCVGTWWEAVRGPAPPPPDFAWRMAAMGRGLAAADTVLAPSQAMAEALRRVYGTRRRIGVVFNGRAPLPAAPLPAAPPAERHGVLAAGRLWDEAKNIALLEDAAAQLPGPVPVPVRAAGPLTGPNGAAIALHVVTALGTLDAAALSAALAEARIFAAPALYEPFGLAVLEAAWAGLPLVLADIPTFRELWGGAATFLPPRDLAAWAAALGTLHADPAACRAQGAQAKARAAAYGLDRFGAAMADELRRLRATPRATAA